MLPLARTEMLTVSDLPDETLVYDRETGKAHCLNRTSTLVWKHCDGRHDVLALTRLLHDNLSLPIESANAAVQLALEQLGRRNLLKEPVSPPKEEDRLSRRDALRKIAVAAAVPLVITVSAPSIAWAQPGICQDSGPGGPHLSKLITKNKHDGTICGINGRCRNGVCVDS